MSDQKKLIFVYNASSDAINKTVGFVHKAVSPQTYKCDLCKLTHGHFKMNHLFSQFLDSLELKSAFYYKNEFAENRMSFKHKEFPLVILEANNEQRIILSGNDFEGLNLNQLIEKLKEVLLSD